MFIFCLDFRFYARPKTITQNLAFLASEQV